MTTTERTTLTGATFSQRLREASWSAHEAATQSPFMQALLGGELGVAGLAALTTQTWFVYDSLEKATAEHRAHPTVGTFFAVELDRKPSISADLAHLVGPRWQDVSQPTPATTAYCDRIAEVAADWPGGLLAHHYVRYLGDLSGGQVIGRILDRALAIEGHEGTSFYVFDLVPDPKEFKDQYRAKLDDARFDADEQDRIISEILEAYRLNTAVLDSVA